MPRMSGTLVDRWVRFAQQARLAPLAAGTYAVLGLAWVTMQEEAAILVACMVVLLALLFCCALAKDRFEGFGTWFLPVALSEGAFGVPGWIAASALAVLSVAVLRDRDRERYGAPTAATP
jgi:hypothetical protein